MSALRRVALATLALSLVSAAPAAAASLKVNIPNPGSTAPNYVYFEGNQSPPSGQMIMCMNGEAYGGHYDGGTKGGEYFGDACPEVSADLTLPPAGGGGGGGEPPAQAPCTDQATCTALLEGIFGGGPGGGGGEPPAGVPCTDTASCEEFFGGLLEGGGGGEPPFALPCSDQASCEEFISGLGGGGGEPPAGGGDGGAPAPRDCTSSSGGAATCFDLGGGNYLVADPPDDGQGELGFCTTSEQAPLGPGYYFIAGPAPDGDAAVECPAAAPAPPAGGETGGGETPPPPPDGDGDGVADANDRCPTTAASTGDGCPAQSSSPPESTGGETGGGETTSDGGSGTTGGETRTPPTTTERQADPAEAPRVDIARQRLRVSRKGRVGIPLACQTTRTACAGELRLTATRRAASGRRVRVLLAEATFHVDAAGELIRRVVLTKAGRRLFAKRGRLGARARTELGHSAGTVVRRERIVLIRR